MIPAKLLRFVYWNHRNEVHTYLIRIDHPEPLVFGTTEHHPEPTWLLTGQLVEKDGKSAEGERNFALAKMRVIKEVEAL